MQCIQYHNDLLDIGKALWGVHASATHLQLWKTDDIVNPLIEVSAFVS